MKADDKAHPVPQRRPSPISPEAKAQEEAQKAREVAEAALQDLLKRGFPAALVHHRASDFDVEVPPKATDLLLCGPNGTGKTALACALTQHWDVKGHFSSAYRILSRIKSTFRRVSNESEEDVLDDLSTLPLLIVDDLGAQQNTEFGLATLYEIIKERCENYRPTIVTTNLTFTEIDKHEPRLASRLAAFKIIKMGGKDRRVKS